LLKKRIVFGELYSDLRFSHYHLYKRSLY